MPVDHVRRHRRLVPKHDPCYAAGVRRPVLGGGFLPLLGAAGDVPHSALAPGRQLSDQGLWAVVLNLPGIQHLVAVLLVQGHQLSQLFRQSIRGMGSHGLHSSELLVSHAGRDEAPADVLILTFEIAGNVLRRQVTETLGLARAGLFDG